MSAPARARAQNRAQNRAEKRAQSRSRERSQNRFETHLEAAAKRPPVVAAVQSVAPGTLSGTAPRTWRAVLLPLLRTLRRVAGLVWTYLRQGQAAIALGKRSRRLRVRETLALGDKRFVSILEVDGQSFLIGSAGAGIALLASLTPEGAPFGPILSDSLAREGAE